MARLIVDIKKTIEYGTCGWWEHELREQQHKDFMYIYLRAGPYGAQVVHTELDTWVLHIEHVNNNITFATIDEAIKYFDTVVVSRLHSFVSIGD